MANAGRWGTLPPGAGAPVSGHTGLAGRVVVERARVVLEPVELVARLFRALFFEWPQPLSTTSDTDITTSTAARDFIGAKGYPVGDGPHSHLLWGRGQGPGRCWGSAALALLAHRLRRRGNGLGITQPAAPPLER